MSNSIPNHRQFPYSLFPMTIKPLMQPMPNNVSYDFRTPPGSPRNIPLNNLNNNSLNVTPTSTPPLKNNRLVSELLQSIGSLGRPKFQDSPGKITLDGVWAIVVIPTTVLTWLYFYFGSIFVFK